MKHTTCRVDKVGFATEEAKGLFVCCRRWLATWLVVSLVALAAPALLTGCSDSDENGTDAGGDTLVVDAGSDATARRTLSILLWDHFVPQHDAWFDPFAQAWADANNVDLTIEHVPIGDLNGRIQDAIAAGEGPDLMEALSPPSALEPHVQDLTAVHAQADTAHGEQLGICEKSTLNPFTNVRYGFAHGWVPDPGNYRKTLWEDTAVGLPNGPSTWEELRTGGKIIKESSDLGNVSMGIGMAHEIDSNMGARALMWSYGASVQDANSNVVINSAETKAAVEFMITLYNDTMTDEVIDLENWAAASNNVALIEGDASYILNSISAYRSAQKSKPATAKDVFMLPPLKGPDGDGFAATHVIPIYMVPKYSTNKAVAEDFLLHLVAEYNEAVLNSEMYNLPCWPSTTPQLTQDTGSWLDQDPWDSVPEDKLAVLKTAPDWTVNIGYPGSANAAINDVFNNYVLPDMFRKAVTGELTVDAAIAEAETRINEYFDAWRKTDLDGDSTNNE